MAVGVVVASEATIAELLHTLRKPKMDRYVTLAEREAFLRTWLPTLEIIAPTEPVVVCRDPRDNMFLELTLAAQATYLVSGDRDLLAVGNFADTTIVTPAAFVKSLDAEHQPP